MAVLIFANGDLQDVDWVRPYLARAAFTIAADGGTRHLWRLEHRPDLVVGDLDSLPPAVSEWLEAAAVPLLTHPHEKDETDLELALLYAVAHYEEEILVFAAFGGRLDQTLANILLLAHPAFADRRVELVRRYERAWLVRATTEISGQEGDTVSLIPLAGDVHVRETRGLRWPLRDEVLQFGPARGVSNTMTSNLATITLDAGVLLCLHTRREWQR